MKTNIKNTVFFELKIIKEYWQIASIMATIIFFGVFFYLENRDAGERLKDLTDTNKELKDRISRLEGQIDVINSNMVLFVEKNPGLTTYRLEMLEEQMDVQNLLNSLDKRRDTDIRIIQLPPTTIVTTQQPYKPLPITEQKSDTKIITETPKKKSLFKKN